MLNRLLLIKESLESVSQWHEFTLYTLFPADAATLVTLRNID